MPFGYGVNKLHVCAREASHGETDACVALFQTVVKKGDRVCTVRDEGTMFRPGLCILNLQVI